jgi:TonB family protein
MLGWFLLVALGTQVARADLWSAQTAYEKKDYATAFRYFKELAELGQPTAQYDLAVMYARGQGTDPSNTNAHAWAALARQNGESRAAALVAQLEPLLTPTSLEISGEIQSKYGAKALDTRLMPRFLHDRDFADRDPVRASKPYVPEYPPDARRRGVQGEAFVEFVVAPDGHARIPRILYALPAGYFESAVRYSVMHSSFLPARVDGTPVATTVSTFYNFKLAGLQLSDYGDLNARVAETLAKAQAGDASAQMLYAMMLAGLPQLHQSYARALPWFLKAAQAGAPYAQYQLGTGLLQGRGCECDAIKGEVWLQKAAQSDQPDAQVTLAEHLLEGRPNHETVQGAQVWLERAANRGNPTADLYLAALLATTEFSDIRNGKRALMLADAAKKDYSNDPTLYEVRAAAEATLGDYWRASRSEAEALERAGALGWDLTALNQRNAMYQARGAWTGNLLAF